MAPAEPVAEAEEADQAGAAEEEAPAAQTFVDDDVLFTQDRDEGELDSRKTSRAQSYVFRKFSRI